MFDFTETKKDLQAAKEWLLGEFAAISTGRAHPGLVENISVESYGSWQPIKNMANIGLEDARTIKITPWDKQAIGHIQKAIQDENLPFSVSGDATGVRVTIPQMTEENRKKVGKLVKEKHEEARVRVRMARQVTEKKIDEAKKANELNEDGAHKSKAELQKLVDGMNGELDVLLVSKDKEVMTV